MKRIRKEDLIIRDSMQLAFAGCDIWCIELDSLNIYTEVAITKFLRDIDLAKRPSSPSLIALHLNETLVDIDLVTVMVTELTKANNAISKVAFIGLNHSSKKLIKTALNRMEICFAYNFINDYEKAKGWLANK